MTEAAAPADSHRVRGVVAPYDPNVFRFSPVLVQENLVDHAQW